MALGFGAASATALGKLPARTRPRPLAVEEANLEVAGATQTPVQRELATPETTTTSSSTTTEPTGPPREFPLVITNGRVIDPETGFDEVANVGVTNGSITAITTGPVIGEQTIDATGLVVAPGFIDILSYEPDPFGIWFKVADGVTTNLAMHGVNARANVFLNRNVGRSPCHFGGAYDNAYVRSTLYGQLNIDIGDAANQAQIDQMVAWAEEDLSSGYIGINFEPEYSPGVEANEMMALARVAKSKNMPCFFHSRFSDPDPPGTNAEAVAEVLNVARETGVAVHFEHLSSTGGTHTMAQTISTIESARAEGLDVTACIYPYTFWATTIRSTRFAPGWQERFRTSYDRLAVAGRPDITITEQNFNNLSQLGLPNNNPLVAAMDTIPEAEIALALDADWIMIGSDGILQEVPAGQAPQNHPRGAGTFARTLGRYVRQTNTIGLLQGLAKMTILPAKRLEGGADAFTRKGRMQESMDADITIFDPNTVSDMATIDNPGQESVGIEWVLIDGQVVRNPDGNVADLPTPGQALTS